MRLRSPRIVRAELMVAIRQDGAMMLVSIQINPTTRPAAVIGVLSTPNRISLVWDSSYPHRPCYEPRPDSFSLGGLWPGEPGGG